MLQQLSAYDPHNAMALDDICARFPTLAKSEAAPGLSDKYRPISTLDTLRQLTAAGFNVHGVQISRVRKDEKRGFEKHVLRLRSASAQGARVGDYFPEVVARNSHDGSGSWELLAGMFRLVCSNGMTVGTQWGAIRVRHSGNSVTERVLQGTAGIADTFGRLNSVIDAMRVKTLSFDAQHALATEAHALRFGPDADKAPVTAMSLLTPRRPDDQGADLWTVFNRLQENTVRGGLQGAMVTRRGPRATTTRAVNGIDANLSLNRGLFDAAERMLLAA